MNTPREAFLNRVRQAVSEGNRLHGAAPLPDRGGTGYQGAGADPVARFVAELHAAGGFAHVVPDAAGARAAVLALVQRLAVRRALLGRGPVVESLGLAEPLQTEGVAVEDLGDAERGDRETLFAADLGISGVEALIAETGSIVLSTRPDQPRALSLLPPVHVAIADRGQLLPDLFDLFDGRSAVPSCLSVITGPSKTGDIELKLVTGVHGPGEVHVVLIAGELSPPRP
jgi:L-lactate utilization protein LutC